MTDINNSCIRDNRGKHIYLKTIIISGVNQAVKMLPDRIYNLHSSS